ncbi:tRNA 5-methylaminomethyl-2-thiouridine biosynthesis bifunctional protein MnmC [mine drainage metagenome]|uniref:tRNA 5-methylaminomethyl-2-thiouridine biosynthesis bifunctional protein MnmC n=1 Tax=mine drainage metagenome TaxID=410659 RepID=A0A1J5RC80_9ZZZZ
MTTEQALIEWRDGQPRSALFDDVYFSRESGIAETRHVFLQHNQLRPRWQNLAAALFTIGETGFGTGLNFLSAWQLWDECAPEHARLHFVSCEKYPLAHGDLARALALWPELAAWSAPLLEQYHDLAPGWRRMVFDDGRVTLTLLVGDARITLPALNAHVDAWFLDGFAPARNPDLWQPELLAEIARLAAPGCTFSTFTSVGEVKRGLRALGFVVEKVAGFGCKREMLRGEYAPGGIRSRIPASGAVAAKHAIVIGGGIAGAVSAWSLATRGWRVTLIERHDGLAGEASGNPQGVLYPRLSGHDIPLGRIALGGYLHTLALLRRLLAKGVDWDDCGLLQQAFNAREAKRCEEILARRLPTELVRAVDADEAGRLSGMAVPHGGLWFPSGGWVSPPAFCHALSAHPGIRVLTASEALRLEKTPAGWQVRGSAACLAEAPILVLAGANDSIRFSQSAHLPLEPVRGQVTLLPSTPASAGLQAVICTEGYVAPARHGRHCIGASFAPNDVGLELRTADHAQNLAMLKHLSPALHQALGEPDPATLAGRAAIRCSTPDYLPMAGPLLDADLVAGRFSPGSRLTADHLPWHQGLYINTGHGSKGMLTAPLCGELLAAMLEGEPLLVDAGLARALDPNRFLLRQRGLKRLIGAAIG